MRLRKNKRLPALVAAVLLLLGALPGAATARDGTVTLKELKAQAPRRLQMSVITNTGQTVTVDAPIVLPEGDALPIVLCKRAAFDTTHIREYYPLEKGLPRYVIEASTAWDYAGSPVMHVLAESKKDILSGKTDYSTRSLLPIGEPPPLNAYTVEQAMEFIDKNIRLFHCDTTPDIRPLAAYALGGLCRVKSVKITDQSSGASWREIVADPEKPIKGCEKGLWDIRLAQYMHGAQIFEDYYPYGMYNPPENGNSWDLPVRFHAQIMDGENCNILIAALLEKETLIAETPLLPFPKVESLIRARMESGKLQSVYQVTLGYSVKIVRGDSFAVNDEWNMDARFVLVPEWQILGYDVKDHENTAYAGYAPPSEEEILMPEMYGRYGLRYELRLDARTGEPVLDYAAMEYGLGSK